MAKERSLRGGSIERQRLQHCRIWQVAQHAGVASEPGRPFRSMADRFGFRILLWVSTGSDTQYYPRVYRNTTPVEPPTSVEQGYHFTADIANDAIRWLHLHDAVASDKPFFIYFATGATHTPHQVPKEWVDKYKGRFDEGWDKLREENFERQKKLGVIPANAKQTPRPAGMPAWNSLSIAEQRLLAHEEEVYPGYAAQADHEIGRVLQAIQEEGQNDNTIVLWIFGDNGGSAQGGPLGRDAHDVTGNPKSLEDRLTAENELGSELFMNSMRPLGLGQRALHSRARKRMLRILVEPGIHW